MRIIVLSLSLLVFTCYNVFSQQAYERAYQTSGDVYSTSVTYSTLDNSLWYAAVEASGSLMVHHIDATGNILASFLYNGIVAENVNIKQSVNGNIYLSGRTATGGSGHYVLALDFTGSVLWTKKYTGASAMPYDRSRFRLLPNGHLMIIESEWGHMGYIEIDENNGNVVASAQLREDTTVENKTPGFAGDVMYDGSFIFTGKRGADIALVHTDPQGQVLWSSVMNSGWAYYHTKGVAACSDGSVLSCGLVDGDGFIMRTDPNGTMQWYNAYSYMVFYDIEQLDMNTFGALSMQGMDVIFTRFDMNGTELNSIRFAQPGFGFTAYDFEVSLNGTIAIPFTFSGMSNSNDPGLFLLETGFNLECGMQSTTLQPATSSSDPSELAVPIYRVDEPLIVTTGACTRTNLMQGQNNMCIILTTDDPVTGNSFALQNSPAEQGQAVTFSFSEYRGDVSYTVTDALGREVIRETIMYNGGNQPILESDQLAAGVYVFTTTSGGEIRTEKFVIK